MNEITYDIKVELGFISKKNDKGNWVDNLDKPAIILSDKFKKYKIPVQNAQDVLDDIQECLTKYNRME